MIDYIKGPISELTPTNVVIECGGIGYDINITLIDHGKLQSADKERVKLYIFEVIREDSHQLYGFTERESRMLFTRLIGVSGVGPNTARLILSSMTTDQLKAGISSGDDSILRSVKGIGAKTAQRIIIDLKDKVALDESLSLTTTVKDSQTYDDALAALVMLGFTSQQSGKALKKLYLTQPDLSTEDAIRQALKLL